MSTRFPCPNCEKPTFTKTTWVSSTKSGYKVTARTRQCLDCIIQFTTYEGRVDNPIPITSDYSREINRQNLVEENSDQSLEDAMQQGKPLIADPIACPRCGDTRIKGTVKSGLGRYFDAYWRYHKCHGCRKGFWTATDCMTGRTKVHKRGLSAVEQREGKQPLKPIASP